MNLIETRLAVLDCGGKAISRDTAFGSPRITQKAVSPLIALPPQSKTSGSVLKFTECLSAMVFTKE